MHDFITGQASFLAKKKSSLLEGEVVVLGAFAESVVIQEALQEFCSIRFLYYRCDYDSVAAVHSTINCL